ncbi:hypothetical protein KVT40_000136 [Elsinoe batatas]|uniref:Uncharacterized protein n=1 Tax=Elsinoe batatas TaxID=2601811 RepID=A0A8K0LAT8_9PEZI|nr:hypothetical protein KVT40_000136 [Elsinoe batatas]
MDCHYFNTAPSCSGIAKTNRPVFTTEVDANTTSYRYFNTVPIGGIPIPPVRLPNDTAYLFCEVRLNPVPWYTWTSNSAWPTVGTEAHKVVIDSATVPLASLAAYISTALPDLQQAGLEVLSPSQSGTTPQRPVPALVVDDQTLLPSSSPMTIDGHVISLPAQPTPAPSTESPGSELMVAVDGTTMPLSQATAIPELNDVDMQVTTKQIQIVRRGETVGENVAGWIMRGLGASSASPAGNTAGSGNGQGGTVQSGSRARNGTVAFTGPSTRLRPVFALGLASLCVGIVASL